VTVPLGRSCRTRVIIRPAGARVQSCSALPSLPDGSSSTRLTPRGSAGLYHAESIQEDFLILMGRVRADHRKPGTAPTGMGLRACPPMTAHTFVAKETGPCVILGEPA
jgi:hypothetical protein